MDDRADKLKGISLAGFTGAMWGLSGILGEILFIEDGATPEWLVSNRLFFSGVLILLYCALIRKDDMFAIFKDKMNFVRLFVLGIFGYTAIQYLFFVTVDLAGASLATILQFTAPAFVYIYMVARGRKNVNPVELTLVISTFVGVILLVTRGDLSSVAITPLGLIAGLGSGIGLAITSIQPRQMLKDFNGPIVTGWAMLFAGILFQFVTPVWSPGFQLDLRSVSYTAIVVIFGTMLAFLAYSASSKYIDASLSSILTVLEPLVATFLSIIIFGQTFNFVEVIGIIVILGSVIGLSAYGGRPRDKSSKISQSHVSEYNEDNNN